MIDDDAPDVTIITVTYNSVDLVERALRSALSAAKNAGLRAEVVVVDNASTDGSAEKVEEMLSEPVIIRNDENRGFGAANNQAFGIATGRIWILLNPDVTVEESTIGRLVATLEQFPRAAAVGPSLGGAGMGGAESAGMLPGVRSALGHFLFINRLLSGDRGGAWRGFMIRPMAGGAPRRVEWVSAAMVALRPDVVRSVGGFDEAIFLYGEDVDLCARLAGDGHAILVAPGARADHLISSGAIQTRWVDGIHDLVRRDGGRARTALFDLIVATGLAVRAIVAAVSSLTPGERAARRFHMRRMAAGARRAATLAASMVRSGPLERGGR